MPEIIKIDATHTHVRPIVRLFEKVIAGELPLTQRIEVFKGEHYLLDQAFKYTLMKDMFIFKDFFKGHKDNPFFQRLLFSTNFKLDQNLHLKIEFLCNQCDYDPNMIFSFEHIFDQHPKFILDNLGLTPLMSHIENKIISILFKNSDLSVYSKRSEYLNTLDTLKNNPNEQKIIDPTKLTSLIDYLDKNKDFQGAINRIKNQKETDARDFALQNAQKKKLFSAENYYFRHPERNRNNHTFSDYYLNKWTFIKENIEAHPEDAYNALLTAFKANNALVLSHIKELEPFLTLMMNFKKNFLVEALNFNKLYWVKPLWEMECFQKNDLSYLDIAARKKGELFSFVAPKIDYSNASDDEIQKFKLKAKNDASYYGARTNFMKNLDIYKSISKDQKKLNDFVEEALAPAPLKKIKIL